MLTHEQLQSMLADLESDRIERTISTSNMDKFGQAICAFANDFPKHLNSTDFVIILMVRSFFVVVQKIASTVCSA